jgi:tetratricopeptide (TPR) repeat protein
MIIRILICVLLGVHQMYGQNRDELMHRAEDFLNSHRNPEALAIYKSLLKTDSSNVELLNRVSFLLSSPSYPGKPVTEKDKLYNEAAYLAQKAIRLDSKNAFSHYHLALALGRLSENATIKVKIANAKQIRISCEKAISLNQTLPGPYHILARWHREVAGFNMLEKAMISTFFGGGLEGGTYEDALKNFKTALKLDPSNPVHYYEIALTYYERSNSKDKEHVKEWLKRSLRMEARNATDRHVLQKANKLLMKVSD